MKALTIRHEEVTKGSLLQAAVAVRGAWIGIRIAGCLLILSGWTSSQVAELFGLSRCAVGKWIRKANQMGLDALRDRPRPGRPPRIHAGLLKELDQALSQSPQEMGISRARWDGVMVVEYLHRKHGIKIHVRHAQRLIHKLGYSLRRPIHRYVQATSQGVEAFREELKKTPPAPPKPGQTGHPL